MGRIFIAGLVAAVMAVALPAADIDLTQGAKQQSGSDISAFDPYVPIDVSHEAGAIVQVIPWGTKVPSMLDAAHFKRPTEEVTIFCAPPGYYMLASSGQIRFLQIKGKAPEPDPGPDPDPDPEPGPDPEPEPDPDVPEPSSALKRLVEPIKAKLAGDPKKADRCVWCFAGFAIAMRGEAGEKIESTAKFGMINSATLDDLDMASGVAIGAEVKDAVAEYVGIDRADDGGMVDRPLTDSDRRKIAEVFEAVSWAGRQ